MYYYKRTGNNIFVFEYLLREYRACIHIIQNTNVTRLPSNAGTCSLLRCETEIENIFCDICHKVLGARNILNKVQKIFIR